MIALYISLGVVLILLSFLLVASYIAYRKTFYADRSIVRDPYKGIDKRGYKPYADKWRALIDNLIKIPCEDVEIRSRDGLLLHGRYYHVADGAPLEIQCHGYRSTPLRDFAGSGVEYIRRGYNMLLIDHRAHGESEGKTISFGIKESLDLVEWIKYSVQRFGADVKIILYGISMGGATVLMATGEELPKNVRCVIADCPYSSPIDIIGKVAGDMGLSRGAVKLFAIIGARLFGGFALRSASPRAAVKAATVPIMIIHGDADSFVPCYMSREIAAENPSIRLEIFEGADHATSYLMDSKKYNDLVDAFVDEALEEKTE